jgi:hypothetical protein
MAGCAHLCHHAGDEMPKRGMKMPDDKAALNYVESCNLGKLGSDGIALRINFAMSAGEVKAGPYQHAVFGLSRELARGLQKALSSVLDETP